MPNGLVSTGNLGCPRMSLAGLSWLEDVGAKSPLPVRLRSLVDCG